MSGITESDAEDAARSALDMPIEAVEYIPDGSNDSFYISTNDDEYVIKFNTFSLNRTFTAEVTILKYLSEQTGLPTPEVVAAEPDVLTRPEPFFITRRIDGEKPDSLSALYRPRLVRKMGLTVLTLDTLDADTLDGYGRIEPFSTPEKLEAGDASWRGYYKDYINEVFDNAERTTPNRFKEYVEPLRETFNARINTVPETPTPAIILPDFRLDNLLVSDEYDVEAILDFERADIGDAHMTLVNTHYLLSRGLADSTAERVQDDLAEGFAGWMDEDKYMTYRLGALAKEVRAFDHWWKDCSEEAYTEHMNRVEREILTSLAR